MKKLIALLLLVALLLTGCAGATGPVTYEYQGRDLTVDLDHGRIIDGQDLYRFERRDTGDGEEFTVKYPNGASVYRLYRDNGHISGGVVGNSTASTDGYIDIDDLCAIIGDTGSDFGAGGIAFENILLILMGVAAVVFGIFCMGNAEGVWQMSEGWKFRNAEPSDLALSMTTIGGVISLIVGIGMILGGIFMR